MKRALDVISIGRSSVDLYGGQVGGRLEDMRTFRKYIGGSPTNAACGAARLGLKSAVITRVGDEHMGRFIREQLLAEGVDVRGVITDPERLTALVLLGIRDQERFPLIFYRENCADMALSPDDIDPDFIAEARCVLASGTHLSHPRTEAATLRALDLARESGAKTILDLDYRPNLWGLSGHGDGENRFIESAAVTTKLQSTLARFDVIVGTEEEFHIAGGASDTIEALQNVRNVSEAALVCKRGAAGATAFQGPIPASLDEGVNGESFAVEVFNVLGAGDGFMAGLLKGWLTGEDWAETLRIANACGALAVSRHGCTPAYPSEVELRDFLEIGPSTPAVRHDVRLEQVHWATNRSKAWPAMHVFAFDHRAQFEEMARESAAAVERGDVGVERGDVRVERGATERGGVAERVVQYSRAVAPEDTAVVERIGTFKRLCLEAALRVANGRDGYGILCDGRLGRDALYAAAGTGLWIGRPVERPGSRPLRLEIGDDFGTALAEWPAEHVVKVLCFYRPDDPEELRADQESTVKRLAEAARAHGLDFLVEIIPSKFGPVDESTTAAVIERFYEIGVFPDWWKLEPMVSDAAWQRVCAAIEGNDPHCRGVVVLGLDAPFEELRASFQVAARHEMVKGFAIGRTIFGDVARAWLGGGLTDDEAVAGMAENFASLCEAWDEARVTR
ncbi:MAG: 5-dehydro-2-deoxygluconokinase [Deltaproteobacteria bacterium]|nr:5-dehydro-2-deoxygluconokinase [Deltaproteobacteria bacterium]